MVVEEEEEVWWVEDGVGVEGNGPGRA